MASILHFSVVFALTLVCVQAQLSKHDSNLLKSMTDAIGEKVNKKCDEFFSLMTSQITTDQFVDGDLCNRVENNNSKSLLEPVCQTSGYNSIKDIVCKATQKSNKDRATLVIKIGKVEHKLSSNCTKKAGDASKLNTWYAIEQLCNRIQNTEAASFKTNCPKDEYSDLKDAVCAVYSGGASTILSCFFTLGLCLVASVFNKV